MGVLPHRFCTAICNRLNNNNNNSNKVKLTFVHLHVKAQEKPCSQQAQTPVHL